MKRRLQNSLCTHIPSVSTQTQHSIATLPPSFITVGAMTPSISLSDSLPANSLPLAKQCPTQKFNLDLAAIIYVCPHVHIYEATARVAIGFIYIGILVSVTCQLHSHYLYPFPVPKTYLFSSDGCYPYTDALVMQPSHGPAGQTTFCT